MLQNTSSIIINKLSKNYKKHQVIKEFTKTIDSSKYWFLIGENGTGKTTFIKCIMGITKYQGIIHKDKMLLSYAPEKINLPDYISVFEFIKLLISIQKKKVNYQQIEYYLEIFDILKYRDYNLIELSKGTKQKIILIQALLIDANVYIFDEPFSGLDETSRLNFIKELKKLKAKNKIIIIATHYLSDYKFTKKEVISFPIKEQSNDKTSQ